MSVTWSITTDAIDDHLRERWKELCGDTSATATAKVYGAISTLRALGLLSTDQAELWEMRLDRCPGHPASSVWCAYCGEVCRYCGLAYGGAVGRCQDLDHCAGCCRLSYDDHGTVSVACGGSDPAFTHEHCNGFWEDGDDTGHCACECHE